jgi:type I restriction enzyme S subunit
MAKPMATSQDFVNWVPTSAVISDWLRVVFTADRDALIRFGKGSVHKTIYFPEWLSASIALPPLAEQVRIVAEVDRHLSIIREVEADVESNLQRAQALRQATLANVFLAGIVNG